MEWTKETLQTLPLETRLLRFHEMSEQCDQRALLATDKTERDHLLALGREWRYLAAETEALLREQQRNHPSPPLT